MFVLDFVLDQIEAELAAHEPERGGALLGPRGRSFVTLFLADPEAEVTSVSYGPSRELNEAVRAAERELGLEFKGVVHSHPSYLDRPSVQDEHEFATGLRVNPHMPRYFGPIVTRAPSGALERHELTLPSGKLSCFVGYRTTSGPASVRRVRVHEVPLRRDAARLAEALGGSPPELIPASVDGAFMPAARVRLDPDVELVVIAGEHYPATAPTVLVTASGSEPEPLELAWGYGAAPAERLVTAVREHLLPPGPYRRAFRPAGGPALTADPERARLAGWKPCYTGAHVDVEAERIRAGLFARGAGLLSAALRQRRVLVLGAGSVGSHAAEQLVRSGVGAVTVVDPDTVEAANLSRTTYDVRDLGAPKAEALARRLLHVNPALDVSARVAALQELAPVELDGLVKSADLVLAATDDPAAQRAANGFAYARGRPAVFVGLYAGAQGGEVIVTVPERTPCLVCAAPNRHAGPPSDGPRLLDYGTGRLQGEVALGADIQHVATAAVKLALSLLLPGETEAKLAGFAERIVADGTTYLTLSMVPDYWFFPELFREVPGQGAYQGAWLTPRRREECPHCGPAERREDPLQYALAVPSSVPERGTDPGLAG